MFTEALNKVSNGQDMTEQEASLCLSEIFSGKIPEEKCVSFLKALTEKGESVDEILGFAKHLSSRSVGVVGLHNAVDTCGTGGSGMARFNVGTTMAFVLASGGYPVAKHGNRGSRKPNGSFDLLEALDVNFELTPEQESAIFKKTGLAFLYARAHHPDMKTVGSARAKMNTRSIFNIIGPLCNPANVSFQVVGISNKELGEKMIQVLKRLGRKRAIVVYGEPGIDEFSISGPSSYWLLNEKGDVSFHNIELGIIGIQSHDFATVPGGDAKTNQDLFSRILKGESCSGLLDMVALNAGAAIHVLGRSVSIVDGYHTALDLISSGQTLEFFESYKSTSNQYL
jgi:anthranilate phosphoribosyltransferase